MTYNSQVGNYTYPTNGIRPHAVTQAGANTYIYDANGNMTSGAGRTIAYNYDNMPSSITKSGVTTTLVYDYAGQRIKKTASSVTTVYIGKLYECTSSVCTKYVFGGSQRIASKKQGVVYYYHTDHLGSSSIITDSTGTKAEEIYYYPYGGTRINQGAVNVKHKFTGQEEDPETGLYYYGARYYDPILGRFISADTIVQDPYNPQMLNRYSYVINNPLIYIDSTGHFIDKLIAAIIIAVVAWAVDESGGNVSTGGQVSADSSGNMNYSSWDLNTGQTYQVNPSSTVGSGSYTTSVELYAWGNGNSSYGYGEDDYAYNNWSSSKESGYKLYADSGQTDTDAGRQLTTGEQFLKEALTHKGEKGWHCNELVIQSIKDVGSKVDYFNTKNIGKSPYFRQLTVNEAPMTGETIVVWSGKYIGHMGFYVSPSLGYKTDKGLPANVFHSPGVGGRPVGFGNINAISSRSFNGMAPNYYRYIGN